MLKADLHIHSNFSDGSDDLKTLISKIKSAGINIFALTDHDTIRGCKEMIALVPNDMKFIPAIELTNIPTNMAIITLNCLMLPLANLFIPTATANVIIATTKLFIAISTALGIKFNPITIIMAPVT